MVVFTCNHCGESLQKPRVEKHYYTTCRYNPKSLTCVDCLKDFRLEEYTVHTQCVTETERYAAKGTVIAVPKGKKKQETWVETVHNVLEENKNNVQGNIKNIYDILLNSNNIPKKQKPFTNFILSSTGNRINQKDIEVVWNIIVDRAKNNSENNSKENQTNGEANDSNKSKKSKEVESNSNTDSEKHQENNDNSKENEMNEEVKNSKKSKKNKKKSKEVETNDNNDLEKVEENEDTLKENQTNGEVSDSKKSKKNKKKSKEVETNGINDTENHQENETINKEESESNTIKKSKKKKKKAKDSNEETVNEAMVIQENNDETEQVKENSKQKKKRKSEIENVETNKTEESPTKKIKIDESDPGKHWENIIIGILKKKPDGITKEKLENKFLKKIGPIEDNTKVIKRFHKKVKALENISCDDNLVKLIV